jgi:hypothetical protein
MINQSFSKSNNKNHEKSTNKLLLSIIKCLPVLMKSIDPLSPKAPHSGSTTTYSKPSLLPDSHLVQLNKLDHYRLIFMIRRHAAIS